MILRGVSMIDDPTKIKNNVNKAIPRAKKRYDMFGTTVWERKCENPDCRKIMYNKDKKILNCSKECTAASKSRRKKYGGHLIPTAIVPKRKRDEAFLKLANKMRKLAKEMEDLSNQEK